MRSMRHVVASAMVLALAAVSGMSLGGCAQRGERMGPAAAVPGLENAGLKLDWQRRLPLVAGEGIKNAWRSGTSVYVHTTESRLFCVNASSGVLAWDATLGAEAFEVYKPIELPGVDDKGKPSASTETLVVTRGTVFVLDKFSGTTKRKASLGLAVAANPVIAGNVLCVGGANRFVGFHLDRLNGVRWQIPSTNDFFGSSPIVVGNGVVVASRKGHLWRIDPNTGDWGWKDRKTNGEVVAGLAADKRAIYVPSLDGRVYAFALDSGAELWESPQLGGRLELTPVAAGNVLLVPSAGQGLIALDPANGHKKWEAAGVKGVSVVAGNKAWVGNIDGTVQMLSLENGEVLGSAPAPDMQSVLKNTVDGQVTVVNGSGSIGSYSPVK